MPKISPRALFALALLALCCAAARAQVTVIRAGRLVDPETGTAAANQTVVVEGKRIKAVGASLPVPAGASVVDLSAYTVLPGLFDAHAHLCMSTPPEDRDLFSNDVRTTGAFRAILGTVNAREMLEAGFTTVRDVGNAGNHVDTDLRRVAFVMKDGKVFRRPAPR